MADAHASVVELSRLDREALEALVMAQQERLLTRNSEIEHLKLIIAKLRRMMFGTKSEKIAREVEQLELQGYRVISGLLEIYNPLLEMPLTEFQHLAANDYHRDYKISTRLFHKLSTKHRLAYGEAIAQLDRYPQQQQSMMEFYYRARLIQDYISGMTDLYAWDEYRRLMAAE